MFAPLEVTFGAAGVDGGIIVIFAPYTLFDTIEIPLMSVAFILIK